VLELIASGQFQVQDNGPAKVIVAIIIIMALWGQKIDRGDK